MYTDLHHGGTFMRYNTVKGDFKNVNPPPMVYFVAAPLIFYKDYVVELGSHSQINYQSMALGNNCYLF